MTQQNELTRKEALLVELLKEYAEKYKVPLDSVMVGIAAGELHVWEYDEGSENMFKQLQIKQLQP